MAASFSRLPRLLTLPVVIGLLAACSGEPTTVTGSGAASSAASSSAAATESGSPGGSGGPADGSAGGSTGSAGAGADGSGSVPSGAASPGGPVSQPSSGQGAGQPPAAGQNPAPAGSGDRYQNPKFGFSGQVPAGYTRSGTVDDRGAIFSGPGGVNWQWYGSNNLNGELIDGLCEHTAEEIEGAAAKVTGNRCTISSPQGQLIGWVGAGSINWLDVKYPAAQSATVTPLVNAAVASFSPGNLAAAH